MCLQAQESQTKFIRIETISISPSALNNTVALVVATIN